MKTTEERIKEIVQQYPKTDDCKFQTLGELHRWQKAQVLELIQKGKVCKWTEDEDYGSTYNTECGEMWSFTEDGVTENRVNFCFYCGGKVEVIK